MGNAIRFQYRDEVSVMDTLAFETVIHDQIEPDVQNLLRVLDNVKFLSESSDGLSGLANVQTQAVHLDGARRNTPELEKHLTGKRRPVACSISPSSADWHAG